MLSAHTPWLMFVLRFPAGLTVTDSFVVEPAKQRSPNMQVVVDRLLAALRRNSARTEKPKDASHDSARTEGHELQISDALRFVLEGRAYELRYGGYQVIASAGMVARAAHTACDCSPA